MNTGIEGDHDVPLGIGSGRNTTAHPGVHQVDMTHVPAERMGVVAEELREFARQRGIAVITAAQREPFSDADAYHRDAIRTRSTTYCPELLSLNWLEQTLSNAAALGRDARRLKKAAFGGVPDEERPGGSSFYMDFNPQRVSPQVLHSMLGIINEAGEMAEMIHAVLSGAKPFDALNWKEEKGDAAWFLFCDCDETGMSAADILRSNIAKLRARFPHKFDAAKLDDAGRDKAAETAALEGRPVHGAVPVSATDAPRIGDAMPNAFRDGDGDPAEHAS